MREEISYISGNENGLYGESTLKHTHKYVFMK